MFFGKSLLFFKTIYYFVRWPDSKSEYVRLFVWALIVSSRGILILVFFNLSGCSFNFPWAFDFRSFLGLYAAFVPVYRSL